MADPSTQRALVYEQYNGPIEIKQVPIPDPKEDEVLVKLHYSGICHSDLHGWLGDFFYLGDLLPIIGGHEGAGEVVKIGSKVEDWEIGDKVGVKLFNNQCLSCEYCKSGQDASCEKKSMHGFVQDGTFQEYVAIRGIDAVRIDPNTDLAAAAPVLCAGVTAYKAIKESNVKSGQILTLTGAAGGLGTFAMQYAKAMGIRVLAIDHPSKEEHCRSNGVEWFIDGFNTPDLVRTIRELTNGGPHGVVNCAVNNKAMELTVEYVRPRGTVVFVALPKESNIVLNTITVIFNVVTIKGSLVGSRLDTEEAMSFLSRGAIKIPYKLVRLDQVKEVFQDMLDGKVTSRCVVDLSLQ